MAEDIDATAFAERLEEEPYDAAYREVLRGSDAFARQDADADDPYAVFLGTGDDRVTVIDLPHEQEFYVEIDPEPPAWRSRLPAEDMRWRATYTVDRGRSSPYDMIQDIVHLLGAAGFTYTPGTPAIARDEDGDAAQYYTHAAGDAAVGIHPDRISAVERGDGPVPALDGLDRVTLESVGADPLGEEVEL